MFYSHLKHIFIIPALSIAMLLRAQSKTLNIGDKLPAITLNNVINYPASELNLSDFKNKSIILDFWNHRCLPCIAAFPKLDSLQKEFDSNLQIIFVNRESKDSTLKFFARRKKLKIPSIPFITGDTLLSALFPSDGYPYHVWIDNNGIIKHLSGGYNTTAQHIRDFIKGNKMALKNPTIKKKAQSAVMNLQNLQQNELKYYSMITQCKDDLDIGDTNGEPVKENGAIRLSSNCSSILDLYKKAYRENGKYNFEAWYSLDFAVKDSFPYILPADMNQYDGWIKTHAYNYELLIPSSNAANRFKIMQQDLSRYFELEASVELRKIKSLVLKRTEPMHQHSRSAPHAPVNTTYATIQNDSGFHFIDQPVGHLVSYLEAWILYDYPFFNEVDDDTMLINVLVRSQSVAPLNPLSLIDDLQNAGLDLCFEEKEIPVLVLRQK